MSKIIVLSYGYPNQATPTSCPFLKELVKQWLKLGRDVEVINPLAYKSYKKCKKGDIPSNEHYPLYCSYRVLRRVPFLRKISYRLADKSFQKAVEKVLTSIETEDAIIYSHFLNAGYVAGKIASKTKNKAYCAFGESELWSIKGKKISDLHNTLNLIDGFISVSKQNVKILLEEDYTTEEKILYAPNGVDLSLFYEEDKLECRKELGFDLDEKIGVFVGHFIDRKGPLRVNEATSAIPGLKMIYIGSGEQTPVNDNIVFCGKVPHDELRKYLCAADFFVLPTKAEGCCNAIIEAMACGLPIISSNESFNDDILDDEYSIRINPTNIEEIRDAIKTVINNDELRGKMKTSAVKASKQFSIEERARKILDFIESIPEG